MILTPVSYSILCLIPRPTVTSPSASKNTSCKTHPLCVNPRCSFLNVWENTQVARARWQASASGIRADVTVVLEVRQSIQKFYYRSCKRFRDAYALVRSIKHRRVEKWDILAMKSNALCKNLFQKLLQWQYRMPCKYVVPICKHDAKALYPV